MENYGQTSSVKDLQTKQSVEQIIGENGSFFSVESTDTILEKEIPEGSLILVKSIHQILTNTSALEAGKSIAEQADKVLVAGGITWQNFN